MSILKSRLSFGFIPKQLKNTAVSFLLLLCGLLFSAPNLQAKSAAYTQSRSYAGVYAQPTQETLSQPNYRIRSDDSFGLNEDSGWVAPQNTAATIDAETPFRIRFEIEETAGSLFNGDVKLQWRKGTGAWTDAQAYDPPSATATEAVGIVVSGQFSDGDETIDLLAGSAASFTPGTGEEDNDTGNIFLSGEHTEIEWNLIIHTFYDDAAQNISGDTFEFRVVQADDTPFEGPYNNPTVTLNVPDGLIGGTYVENPNRIGPFMDTNGALYAVIEPSETFNRFMVVKSADGGNTWVEVDGINRPGSIDLESVDVVQVGDTLHIAHLPNNSVLYHRFLLSDHPTAQDTWEFTDEIVVGDMDQTDQATALAVRSDGTVVIFYRRSAPEERVMYKIRSVAGLWGPENELDAGLAPNDTTWVTVVKGANEKIHIFYQDRNAPAIYHKSLDNNDLLSDRETVTTDVGSGSNEQMSIIPPIYWDDAGNEQVLVGFKSGLDGKIYTSIITNDGSPSVPALASDNVVLFGFGASRAPAASLAVDGTNIYLHYSDSETGDIFRDENTNGSGWGTDVEEIDDATGHWLRSNAFTHSPGNGGGRVVGYIWDNGSAGFTGYIRYNEYQVPGVDIAVSSGTIGDVSEAITVSVTMAIPANQLVQQVELDVHYDNNIITATDSIPDPGSAFSSANCTVDTPSPRNSVAIDNFESSGVSGQITLCQINFDALDSGSSPLTLTVKTLTNPTGLPLTYALTYGEVTVNSPPVANDDQVNTTNDKTVTLDVTANDSDPDGNLDLASTNLSCANCTIPANGTLVNGGNGTFNYTPDSGFIGLDNFIYQICDGEGLCDTAVVTITVNQAIPNVIEVQLSAASDDAEESEAGSVTTGSSDLELVSDGSDNQTVGIRFNEIAIPPGSNITNATIQFQVDEAGSNETSLLIEGENSANAQTFTSAIGNISTRPRTAANVSWSPFPWETVGEAGPNQQTPNLASIIQEIVNRPGWASGSSLAIIITGSGSRVAEAFESDPAAAPLLRVDFTTAPLPPLAVEDSAVTAENTTLTIDLAANDSDPDDNLDPTSANVTCSGCSQTANGALTNNGDGTFTYTPNPGFSGTDSFVYEICDTSALPLCDTAVVTITIIPGGATTIFDVRVATNSDDAEESDTGSISLGSSDLELVEDGARGAQLVGLRFTNVTIPQGATIVNATIQFQADETSSGPTDLTIFGEASDNADTFNFGTNNISSRTPTVTAVSWSPVPPWPATGEAGQNQQTPDIAAVIQEIVDRPGWTNSSSLVIMITGSGKRVAEAYDGLPEAAPMLQVEYQLGQVNEPPMAVDDGATTAEEVPVLVDVTANDSDPDGNLDSASANTDCGSCSQPANGALVNNGDGTFTYTPNLDFDGVDSFVYEVCDTSGLCDTAVVTITVDPVNDPPIAVADSPATTEDTVVIFDVTANDSDPDGNLEPASTNTDCGSCSQPANGTLTNNGDGTFTYTPILDFNGSDSFTYEVCDDQGACDTAMVTITVSAVDDPPAAVDDSATTSQNTAVQINVAANDTDPENNLDPAAANTNCGVCTSPANGALANNGDGTFTYTPDSAFTGEDTFVYQICDTTGLCDTAVVTITVSAVSNTVIESRVAASQDDAEESDTGSVSLSSSDLELVVDDFNNRGAQTVGLRFNNITIPPGATIVNATIQFQTDEPSSDPTSLVIEGERIDNASAFANVTGNISGRLRTAAAVAWSPGPWLIRDEAGPNQQTPDIAAVIEEIVGQQGWLSGNSLAIIISGSGSRVAEAFDGNSSAAPLLHVEYTTGVPTNDSPVAATDSAETQEDTSVTIDVASNDNDPDGNLDASSVNINCAVCSQPTNGVLVNNSDGSFKYTPDPGFNGTDDFIYEICDTGGLCDTAAVSITVTPAGNIIIFEVRVAASSDDAEEGETGEMARGSSDLELVEDDIQGVQLVGLRFNNISIPQGSAIVNATIQFQAEESQSGQTDLTIYGEASDNAATFASPLGNISGRSLTQASANWSSIPAWTAGEAGPAQQTPDFTAVIQEIVNRAGWSSGNSLVIILTGSGKRVAEAYDGLQTAAPLLHVEYVAP